MFSNIHNHPGLPNYGTHLFIHSTDIYEQLPETNPQKSSPCNHVPDRS